LRKAQSELGRAGLFVRYVEHVWYPFIEIGDPQRWVQVCSITRIREDLLMTTNCLKSINGHANSQVARLNKFRGSMSRLANMVEHVVQFFGSSLREDFNSAIRKRVLLSRAIGEAEISKQKVPYRTNEEDRTCRCGMTVYWTSVYHSFVPCCHTIHAYLPRPRGFEPPTLDSSRQPAGSCVLFDKIP
jgi:hypothetical protein